MKNYYPGLKRADDKTKRKLIEELVLKKPEPKKNTPSEAFDKFFAYPKPDPVPRVPTKNADDINQLFEQIIEEDTRTRQRKTDDIIQDMLYQDKIIRSKCFKPMPLTEKIMTNQTLVVNLFGGPGCGKSTIAAGIFFELKSLGINCELASEFCKDLAWEERHETFKDQIYIFGKQYHRIFRLLGKVDVIIVDSPLLLTSIYDKEQRKTLRDLVVSEHCKMWTYNAFIKRKKTFNPKGRIHDEEASKDIDIHILNLLDDINECYECHDGTPEGKDNIVKKICMLLNFNKL